MSMDFPRAYGDYVLLQRLGQGGMSEVDLARKRKVAEVHATPEFLVVKRIKADRQTDDAFVRMFKDEARITAELRHENIGQVFDFAQEGDEYFMVLEYVPGVDVRHLISVLRDRGQRVPVLVALRIIHDVLRALDYAHNRTDALGKPRRIVHRDVNPRNVMLSIRGDVKLIDFGVASATDRLERTRTDHVKGKFAYMAPEQIAGQAIDHRADLYAVGLTLHELLAGQTPFQGLNQVQIMHRMMSGEIDALPRLAEVPDPEPIRDVHRRALARDRNERFDSAERFRKAIEACAEPLGGLPSRAKMAEFLATVDPELPARIQRTMETYATLEFTADGEVANPPDEPLPPPLVGRADAGAPDSGTMTSVTRTTLAAVGGGVALVSITTVMVVSAAMLSALFVIWWMSPEPTPSVATPAPAPVAAPMPPEPAPPTPAPAPVVPVAPEPAPEPVAPAPAQPTTKPGPTPKIPQPAPVPEPELPEPPAPEPALPEPVIPEPATVAPEPEPAPVAEADMATLQITSEPKGLTVYVNGKEVGPTPKSPKVAPGTHVVEIVGFAPQTVVVKPGARLMVTFKK